MENPLENRDDLLDLFITCINIGQPEHPYLDNPYPITRDQMDAGWCRSDGPYWAKCGPRRGRYVVRFDPCTKRLLSMDFDQLLAVITHEIAHVTEGNHTAGPGHNKAFWREMAFMAWQIRERLDEINERFGVSLSDADYITEVIYDPNQFTVDRRIETVTERRTEMAELLGVDDVSVIDGQSNIAKNKLRMALVE